MIALSLNKSFYLICQVGTCLGTFYVTFLYLQLLDSVCIGAGASDRRQHIPPSRHMLTTSLPKIDNIYFYALTQNSAWAGYSATIKVKGKGAAL